MISYIIRRILSSLIVVLIVSIFTFSLIHMIPGDPVYSLLGQNASHEQYELLRARLGLNLPLYEQYWNWLIKVIHGDFGRSIIYNENIMDLIKSRVPVTLYLGTIALILTVVVAIPAGIISAVRHNSILDEIITVLTNLGMATPIFWLGILGIYLFSLQLKWLPVQGYTSPLDNFWLSTKQIIMPVVCLAIVPIALLTRQVRSAMLEVIHQDYIRTAWSKGLREPVVIIRHALKNALIPIITLLGLQIGTLLAGAVLIETVFNIAGMGRLLVTGVFEHDYFIVQDGVLIIGTTIALANLVTDISYGYLDPRIKNE
jgi:peptide/nickel transport system permease protein